MTDTNHRFIRLRAPRVADWFLLLFVSQDQAPPILGDLREEFLAVASRRGKWSARLWYWRQVAKTVPHLFYAQLVLGPWQVFSAVVAGLVLLALAYMPLYVVQPVRVLSLPGYYFDWPEPLRLAWIAFWGPLGFPIVLYILPSILVGWIVARASQGRDMVVTIVFSCTTFLLGMIVHFILFLLPSRCTFTVAGLAFILGDASVRRSNRRSNRNLHRGVDRPQNGPRLGQTCTLIW